MTKIAKCILERSQARKKMENQLAVTILRIIDIVNSYKDHIPPIMTADPFPYKIFVPQKGEAWSARFFKDYWNKYYPHDKIPLLLFFITELRDFDMSLTNETTI